MSEHMSLSDVVLPTQVHPLSTWQSLVYPSPDAVFPSSQFLSNLFPSPQIYEQTFTVRLGVKA